MPRGNPLGLGLVLVGAAMMLVSVFLPLNQPAGPFGRVQDNSLIQHGGWILVALAVAIAAAGYQASREWAAAHGVSESDLPMRIGDEPWNPDMI